MSTEDKDFSLEAKPTIRRTKPTPVASANGHETSRAAGEVTPGRRRRVRITTGEVAPPRFPQSTRRFGSDRQHDLEERVHYPRREYSQPQHTQLDRPEGGIDYEQQYQAKRAEGSFDYNYNRSERPKRMAQPKLAADGTPLPGKGLKKKKKKKVTRPIEPVKYQPVEEPTTEIRLNKYLANAGVCSRREADQLISQGEITVNGEVITELGKRVTPQDIVEYKGNRVQTESKVYVLLNKPKNCVTTSDDPECRLTVMDIVRNACPERIYPVGRLDRHTTGVILITNDGDLSSKLTHPSFMKKKIYHVWLNKPVEIEHMQQIADGLELEDGEIHADAISYVKEDDLSQVGIEIHSGRNRIVRRIFEHLGYRVVKLDRVYFAGLTKKNLPRGRWRYLNEEEVNALRMGAFE